MPAARRPSALSATDGPAAASSPSSGAAGSSSSKNSKSIDSASYCKAFHKACEGDAKRKYFEHAGALMTADGSGDDLIKLEGVPKGEKFEFMV